MVEVPKLASIVWAEVLSRVSLPSPVKIPLPPEISEIFRDKLMFLPVTIKIFEVSKLLVKLILLTKALFSKITPVDIEGP